MDGSRFLKRAASQIRPRILGKAPTGAIGIDFGTEKVNLVQVSRPRGHRIVRAAASVPYECERDALLDSPVELKRLIRHALTDRPFRGRKVVASVPPSIVEMLVINYRCNDEADEEAAIVRATEERIGDSIATRVIDYLPISRAREGSGRAALVAVANHDAVVRFLETLRKCSLDVVALEVGPVAIQRLISAIDKTAAATAIAVTFGEDRSYVTVLSNGEMLLDRTVEFGTRTLTTKLGEALDCPPSEAHELLQRHGLALTKSVATDGSSDPATGIKDALTEILKPHFIALAKDLTRIRDYAEAETRSPITGPIYAFGSLARWPNADKILSSLCGAEISSVNPFYGLDIAQDAADMSDIGPICGVAVATGLALREGA